MDSVNSSLFKSNSNENFNSSLTGSLFSKIDIELIKEIFSFLNQQNSRKSLSLTCRTFLKFQLEFFDNYTPLVKPPIDKNQAIVLAKDNDDVKLKQPFNPPRTVFISHSLIFNPRSSTLNPSSPAFKPSSPLYIEGAVIKKSSLIEFMRIPKEMNLKATPFITNFVAFLNTIKDGEIAKIYFGINNKKISNEGKIVGIVINPKERDLLLGGIWNELTKITPPLTSREFDVRFIPICSKDKKVFVQDLYLVEIQVKSPIHSVYFTQDDRCLTKQNGKIQELMGTELTKFCEKRLRTQAAYISSNPVLIEFNAKLLRDMPVEELERLEMTCQKAVEVSQRCLEMIKNTLEEKEKTLEENEEALFMEQEKEIADLKKQLESLET
jgi:hypothetical protein